MAEQESAAVRSANKHFRKEEQAREGAAAWKEYIDQADATRLKTARLRAQRFSKRCFRSKRLGAVGEAGRENQVGETLVPRPRFYLATSICGQARGITNPRNCRQLLLMRHCDVERLGELEIGASSFASAASAFGSIRR